MKSEVSAGWTLQNKAASKKWITITFKEGLAR